MKKKGKYGGYKKSMALVFRIVVLMSVVGSCNIINTRNINNDFKWKNKKLKKAITIGLDYNPVVLKRFDSISEFNDYFKDSLRVEKIHLLLINKLAKRNFIIVDYKTKHTLIIDTLSFEDSPEMVSVLSNDGTVNLGSYEKNNITIKIIGTLRLKNFSQQKIKSEYNFEIEPRESYIFKGSIAYKNFWIDMDVVENNIVNRFSYECYKKIKE